MKKVLIASVCAFALCLTSCASKQAPLEETQQQAPQTEIETAETNEDSAATEPENTQAEETTEESSSVPEEESSENTENTEDTDSELFPEPEVFEEPEIITLEPVEEPAPAEEESSPEQIEEEEPPLISEPEVSLPPPDQAEEAQTSEENENPEESSDSEDADITDYSDPNDITLVEGGIDITDEDPAEEEEYSEKEIIIIPSRSVTLKKFEYLDITYPGSGWVYMGLTDNSKDLAYFGRKLGTKDTQFSLQARAAGTKIVHFYRNDPLTGQYLDDYLEVVILAESGSNKTHIQAPEYKLPVQKKEKPVVKEEPQPEEAAEETTSTEAAKASTEAVAASSASSTNKAATASSENTASTAESAPAASASSTASTEAEIKTTTSDTTSTGTVTTTADSDSLLQEAQVLYNEKEYAAALKKLNQFFEYSTDNRDQALYLQGQILEAKSEIRDIKGAIDAYSSLTKNYPASKLWDNANKRIIYLKRFYLEVR